jgi:hypothetical protein
LGSYSTTLENTDDDYLISSNLLGTNHVLLLLSIRYQPTGVLTMQPKKIKRITVTRTVIYDVDCFERTMSKSNGSISDEDFKDFVITHADKDLADPFTYTQEIEVKS